MDYEEAYSLGWYAGHARSAPDVSQLEEEFWTTYQTGYDAGVEAANAPEYEEASE